MNDYMVSVILKTPGPFTQSYATLVYSQNPSGGYGSPSYPSYPITTQTTIRSDFAIKESDPVSFMGKLQKEIMDSKFIVIQDANEGMHMFATDQIAAIHISKIQYPLPQA